MGGLSDKKQFYHLQLLLTSILILRSKSCRSHDRILLSEICNPPSLEQVGIHLYIPRMGQL
jgi:hypothetical protein